MINPLHVLNVWPEAPGEKTIGVWANIDAEKKVKNKAFRYIVGVLERGAIFFIIFSTYTLPKQRHQKYDLVAFNANPSFC